MKQYIAFQTVDRECDIWGNKAFLFETEEQVENFFHSTELLFDTLGIELDEEILDYSIHRVADFITAVTFEYDLVQVRICRMNKGFMIGEQK